MSEQPNKNQPSDAAILERACSFANEAMWAVALQRRRLHSKEPEDDAFFRIWTDLRFFIVSLRRVRRAAHLAAAVGVVADDILSALRRFDDAVPSLTLMRNVAEHFDDYAVDSPRRRHKAADRRQLQVQSWNGTTFRWLGESLNVDVAHDAAFELYSTLRATLRDFNSKSA